MNPAEEVARQTAVLHTYRGHVEAALADLEKRQAAARIWAKDPHLWTADARQEQNIRQSLGWLTVAPVMRGRADELVDFAQEVTRAGFRHVLLLGMGGSSLCPDLLRLIFRSEPGFPRLHVLDTTDPAGILAVEGESDLRHTLVIVSSKSGTTPETVALQKYFWAKGQAIRGERVAERFVAITDAGSPLEAAARASSFRRLFVDPPDIGGRYAALSCFGLVPAALMGLDVARLLTRAERMARACRAGVPPHENLGLMLGAILGSLALQGRDKVTLVCSPEIAPFGAWVEQLIAESTGKEGRGIVPVEGEEIGEPSQYGDDRLFVYLRLEGTRDPALDARVRALEEAGHPTVTLRLQDLYDLGVEFFRWEFATAVAGTVLGVNPFDQPDVQESKAHTERLLKEYTAAGRLPEGEPIFSEGGVRLYGDPHTVSLLQGCSTLTAALTAHLSRIRRGEYVALTVYLPRSAITEKTMAAVRRHLRDRCGVATTLGYGPRFLHSTGQLHKGGGDAGLFLQFTGEDREDLPIPGGAYTFGVMKRAQALGDLLALGRRGRRVLQIHLAGEVGLAVVESALRSITRPE